MGLHFNLRFHAHAHTHTNTHVYSGVWIIFLLQLETASIHDEAVEIFDYPFFTLPSTMSYKILFFWRGVRPARTRCMAHRNVSRKEQSTSPLPLNFPGGKKFLYVKKIPENSPLFSHMTFKLWTDWSWLKILTWVTYGKYNWWLEVISFTFELKSKLKWCYLKIILFLLLNEVCSLCSSYRKQTLRLQS